MSLRTPARGRRRLLLLAGLVLLAVAARALPWPLVLAGDRLDPPEPDAYYHLRRIEYTAQRFPALLSWDAYLAFPEGAHVLWPPLFDGALGTLAAGVVALGGDRAAMERVVAWVPPLLGALAVLLVGAAGARRLSPGTGLLAGALLAVLPAHVSYSRLGFVDHHVAVSCLTAVLLFGAMGAVTRQPPGARRRAPGAAGLGLALGGIVALWPGALLHAALVQAALAVWTLAAGPAAVAQERARWLALAHAVASGVVAPFALGPAWERFGAFSPLVLSWLQPVWFASGAACFALLAALWGWSGGPRRSVRIAQGVGVGLGGVLAALALVPGLAPRLLEATGWFAKEEEFLGTVAELRPLFAGAGGRSAERTFTRLVWITPLLLAGAALAARRKPEGPAVGLLVGVGTGLFAATLLQQRFGNSFAVAFALVAAYALLGAGRAARRRLPRHPAARAGIALAGAATALFVLAPVAAWYRGDVRNAARALRGEPPVVDAWWRKHKARAEAAVWLGAHSTPTHGWLDPQARPDWGVLSPWSDGHAFRYLARRPVVLDNFGVYGSRDNWELTQRYYAAASEEEGLAIAERLRVRFVVGRPTVSAQGGRYAPDTLAARLRAPFRTEAEQASLRAHRLVFASSAYPQGAGRRAGVARYAIWEIVPGARAEGLAAPGAEVGAELALRTADGRAFRFRAEARADAHGHFVLHLPYPTQPFGAAVRPEGPYRITSGGVAKLLAVRESAVSAGRTLPVPALHR